jgi:hypothetical protein
MCFLSSSLEVTMTILDYPFAEISAAAETSPGPQWLPWPVAGNPGGQVNFASYAEWPNFFSPV